MTEHACYLGMKLQQRHRAIKQYPHCIMHAQVPLKRVNQAYVIATSSKVNIKGADVSKLEDSHFKAAEKPREKKGEDSFFKKDTEPEEKVRTTQSHLVIILMASINGRGRRPEKS